MMIPVLETEPFVGLRGPDPGSKFMDKPTNPPTTGPFGNDLLAQTKVSPEAVWGGVGTKFSDPEREINEVVLKRPNANLNQL